MYVTEKDLESEYQFCIRPRSDNEPFKGNFIKLYCHERFAVLAQNCTKIIK